VTTCTTLTSSSVPSPGPSREYCKMRTKLCVNPALENIRLEISTRPEQGLTGNTSLHYYLCSRHSHTDYYSRDRDYYIHRHLRGRKIYIRPLRSTSSEVRQGGRNGFEIESGIKDLTRYCLGTEVGSCAARQPRGLSLTRIEDNRHDTRQGI